MSIDWKARAEQLERERDEALKELGLRKDADRDATVRALMGHASLEARLAKVPALVEALREIGHFTAAGRETFTGIPSTEAAIARAAINAFEEPGVPS